MALAWLLWLLCAFSGTWVSPHSGKNPHQKGVRPGGWWGHHWSTNNWLWSVEKLQCSENVLFILLKKLNTKPVSHLVRFILFFVIHQIVS